MLLVPTTGEQDDNGESSHYTPLSLNLVEGASPSPSKTYSSSSSGVVELVLQLSRVRGAAERFAADDVRVIEVGTEVSTHTSKLLQRNLRSRSLFQN